MSELGTYQGASTIRRKTLDWNRSRISMLEVEDLSIFLSGRVSGTNWPCYGTFVQINAKTV
jgi:hypothetical protein